MDVGDGDLKCVVGRKGRCREVIDSNFRVDNLNIGVFTRKFLELVNMLKKNQIDIFCIQETKWNGDKSQTDLNCGNQGL